jgi:tyrosine-protein kinase Etk/Wzc
MREFSILDLLIILLRKKKNILLHFSGITILAIIVSFVIPRNYKASTLFLPPQDETGNMPMLALGFNLNLGGQSAFSAQQILTLLDSRTILERIVKQFDLMNVYKTIKRKNNLEKAIKILRSNTKIKTVSQSSLAQEVITNFELSVVDKDPQRAADIANAMLNLLNSTMEELSRTQESYTVTFIKSRLDSVESAKQVAIDKMVEFQKAHKIYAPEMKEQLLGSVGIFVDLRKERIMSEIERDMLLMDNQKDSRAVKYAERKIGLLDDKMKNLEQGSNPDILPPLGSSVEIARQYMELFRESEILIKLETLLRQQYEEARIKNARRAPVVRIVDRAQPPQWKNFPKRAVVVLLIVSVYMLGLIVMLLAGAGLHSADDRTKRKVAEFKSMLRFRKQAKDGQIA